LFFPTTFSFSFCHTSLLRARNPTRNVQAIARCTTSSDIYISPSPVSATTASALNIDVRSSRLDGTTNTIKHKFGDSHAVRRLTSGSIVSLVDDNSVLGDIGQSDPRICDAGDGPGVARDGLNANTVLRGFYFTILEEDCFDSVVAASTDTTDGETVASGADAAREGDALARFSLGFGVQGGVLTVPEFTATQL
jgi:hypothetical protein